MLIHQLLSNLIKMHVSLSPFLYSNGQSSSTMRGFAIHQHIFGCVMSLLSMMPLSIKGPALLNLAPRHLRYVGIPFDVDGLHSGVVFDSVHCVKCKFTHEIKQQWRF